MGMYAEYRKEKQLHAIPAWRCHVRLSPRAFQAWSDFQGTYVIAKDPLVTDKERVQMMVEEIWKVTGYRFMYVQ